MTHVRRGAPAGDRAAGQPARPDVGQPAGPRVRRHDRDRPARPVHARADGAGTPGPRRRRPAGVPVPDRGGPARARPGQHRDQGAHRPRRASTSCRRRAGTILLDAGTTTSRFASLLPPDHSADRDHARRADRRAARRPAPHRPPAPPWPRPAYHPGSGRRRHRRRRCPHLRVDVAFIGTNGITAEHGLTTPDPDEAAVKRALIESGRRVVALADASKFGVETAIRFAAAGEIDVLVTDGDVSPTDRRALSKAGVDVVVA